MTARPFLKWAGGKTQLAEQLVARWDRRPPTGRYFEPFLGGGALFFELRRSERLRHGAVLSDANPNLIDTWRAVRDHVDALVAALRDHQLRHGEEHYYAVRRKVPTDAIERAARMIYLNKTCFNGLYRENSKGAFNVPFGRHTNPTVCDEPNLRAVAAALAGVQIHARPFDHVLKTAREGDFVYFDPPYVPLSKTASFTRYAKGDFGEGEQTRLAAVYAELAERGVAVLLSNSMTPLVTSLYAGFSIETVDARRTINRDATKRGTVQEALVYTFRTPVTNQLPLFTAHTTSNAETRIT